MQTFNQIEAFFRPLPANIAEFIGSSDYQAFSDDSLKDEDNAAWIMRLELNTRQPWLDCVQWIRCVDRLAENDLLDGGSRFQTFYRCWQDLRTRNIVASDGLEASVLHSIWHRWFQPQRDELRIQTWENYLDAIDTYHQPNLTIETLQDFDRMLDALAGNFFQLFPFLEPHQFPGARAIGCIDQFYNIMRDLREDADLGVCYFPKEILDRFGLDRQQMLDRTAIDTANYRDMMAFWFDEYLPPLIQNSHDFLEADDLHPSWQILRYWSLHRYSRIEQVFYVCNLDYTQFPEVYWDAVRRDLDRDRSSWMSNVI
ncbi:MAG: squalene/phytoene synthase family protein [Cyanobacteria bacterium SID2]|nr:squalene/phytoene synthase family protein [Cyanobacteria bacterium SID2]MBP0006429.1 squalene/phytoene synthase family protein [Cyanobacteria bacterium SBC]